MLHTLKNQSLFVLCVIFSLPFFHIKATNNLQDELGNTPLHIAVDRGDHIVVTELIARVLLYGDLNVKNHSGETPLHLAVMHGNELIVRLLAENYADLNAENKFRETPLHFAVKYDNESIVRFLLMEQARYVRPNSSDDNGLTPLHLAAKYGRESIVRLLLQALHAINYREAVQRDVQSQDREGRTPLHFAARGGHILIVDLLLQNGAQVVAKESSGETPLHWAIESKNIALVELLIKHSDAAPINIKDNQGFTPVDWAAKSQNIALVKLLIQHRSGSTPLHSVSAMSNEAIVRFLLEHDAEIDIQNDYGNTPLHSSLPRLYKDYDFSHMRQKILQARPIVRLLIEHGAMSNIRNTYQYTPLDVLLDEKMQGLFDLFLVEIILHAEVDFDSKFLLEKMLKRRIWLGNTESEEKIWANNEDSHTKFTYLMENYPNLALQILTKILTENNQQETNNALINSFINAARSTFGKLGYFKALEKLRFFYANQLLWQWKRNFSLSLRNIFAKKSVDLSLIKSKRLQDEVNLLLTLLQVDPFDQSTGVKESQDRMDEQAQIFTQSVCFNLANSFLLNDHQESAQGSIKRICIDSNQLGSASCSLAFEFQKLLIKLPKAYSSTNKDIEEKYLLNKLQIVMGFYNYLESIVALQGKLPDVKNDDQNLQAGFFAGKDILSPVHIKKFMNWCNQ